MRFATLADKALIESICNHPEIRLWTACDGAPLCDAAKYLLRPSFTVVDERGCFLALCIDHTRYVIHTNLLPNCRGDEAVRAAHEALTMAFIETDATELLTMVPATLPHAKSMARRMGFRHQFDRNGLWPVDGVRQAMGFYSMTLADWIAMGHLIEQGKWFHERLNHESAVDHPDDPIHDAFVGAAVEMVRHNNIKKAIDIYNRWARFALYEQIRIAGPGRIGFGRTIIRIEGDQFHTEAEYA